MTGLYPDRHGATDRRVGLTTGVRTLAKELKHAGYETVAFTGGGYLDPKYGFARGFDRYDAGPDVPERAVDYLAWRPAAGRPLFLFLHTFTVHDYVVGPPDDPAGDLGSCLVGERPCPPAAWDELRRRYAARVARFDATLGRLVDVVRTQRLWDSTIIVLLADHGEGFAPDRGRIHHGGRLHEDVIRIPLLVHVPGVRARAVTTPVSTVDVMPTLLDLAGAARRGDVDGVSLAPLLRGGAPPPERALFAMEYAFFWTAEGRREVADVQTEPVAVAVMRGRDWYIHARGADELYDMAREPGQHENLIGSEPPAALRALATSRGGAPRGVAVAQSDLHDRLHALGYVR